MGQISIKYHTVPEPTETYDLGTPDTPDRYNPLPKYKKFPEKPLSVGIIIYFVIAGGLIGGAFIWFAWESLKLITILALKIQ